MLNYRQLDICLGMVCQSEWLMLGNFSLIKWIWVTSVQVPEHIKTWKHQQEGILPWIGINTLHLTQISSPWAAYYKIPVKWVKHMTPLLFHCKATTLVNYMYMYMCVWTVSAVQMASHKSGTKRANFQKVHESFAVVIMCIVKPLS